MTAPASVVDLVAGRDGLRTPAHIALTCMFTEARNGVRATERDSELATIALARLRECATPHPAEQDAREAVAWRYRSKSGTSGWMVTQDPTMDEWPNLIVQPLYLTQAASDGCSDTVDHDRVVADLADELVFGGGLSCRAEGLVVVERSDRSDPHYRLCAALEARRAASPAPPAQGAGG